MRDGLIIIRKLNFPRLWLVPKKLFFLTNSLAKLSVGRFIIRQLFAVCTAQQADTDCSVSASRPFKRKFSATMLQIYEFSNLLCVIVLVILFFLIKMEGSLPAREPTENDEPLGYVRRSELNRNGERRLAGESENHSIRQRRNYPTENDER